MLGTTSHLRGWDGGQTEQVSVSYLGMRPSKTTSPLNCPTNSYSRYLLRILRTPMHDKKHQTTTITEQNSRMKSNAHNYSDDFDFGPERLAALLIYYHARSQWKNVTTSSGLRISSSSVSPNVPIPDEHLANRQA
jgi:hypothetical protein